MASRREIGRCSHPQHTHCSSFLAAAECVQPGVGGAAGGSLHTGCAGIIRCLHGGRRGSHLPCRLRAPRCTLPTDMHQTQCHVLPSRTVEPQNCYFCFSLRSLQSAAYGVTACAHLSQPCACLAVQAQLKRAEQQCWTSTRCGSLKCLGTAALACCAAIRSEFLLWVKQHDSNAL